MHGDEQFWVLILAAGEGSRLRSLTTTASGTSIPKQFCSLHGGPSLLQEALNRARSVTVDDRVCAVVAAQHRPWWRPQLADLDTANVIIQPQNRGTANGILLALLGLLESNRGARILLLPADHHVCDEFVLARAMRDALRRLRPHSEATLLLGLEPDQPDPQLGYIVPGEPDDHGVRRPARFVEKPTTAQAQELIGLGALWNGFIMASTVHGLLGLFSRSRSRIVHAMRQAIRRDLQSPGPACAVAALYDQLPTLDFSRDILADQVSSLRVLRVRACGWSDLGTPEGVAVALQRPVLQTDGALRQGLGQLSLAAQQQRLRGSTTGAGRVISGYLAFAGPA